MKKLIHLPLIVLALLLTLASNCKKPKEKKYLGRYSLVDDVKDYLYFKPGSYWVYECDSTLQLDSQVMLSIDTPWYNLDYIDYQLLMYKKKSYSFNTTYNTYYPNVIAPYCEKCKYDGFRNVLAISGTNISATDCVFFNPFDSTISGAGGSSPTKYKGYIDSMEILGKKYYGVRKFQFGTSGFPRPNKPELKHDALVTVYWARNIGVIKTYIQAVVYGIEKQYWYNWNLKEYKILKV